MVSKSLPTNHDATYSDDPADPSVQIHQAEHDDLAEVANLFDYDAMVAGSGGQVLTKDGGTGLYGPVTPTAGGGGTGVTGSKVGWIMLDDYTGTDDARLTSALADAQQSTYPPVVKLGNRSHSFATGLRAFYTGLRLEGPAGYANPERNSGTKGGARCALSMTGGWFEHTGGDVFSLYIGNLSMTGGSSATFITRNASATGTLYCLMLTDISASGLRSIIGTQANKVLTTASMWGGLGWEINNCYSGAFHIGGSDSTLWPQGMLLDSGTAFNTAGSANGQYHLWFDSMEKSAVGPLYITAEGPWNGIRVSGPANPSTSGGSNLGGPLEFSPGMKVEGRNSGAACNGSLIRVEGGIARFWGTWIAYGMASPSTPGHSPADAGIVHHSGGHLGLFGATYDRASGVAETVPFVYQAAALKTRVKDVFTGSKGGSWTGLPRVDEFTTGSASTDDTVTAI